MTNQFVRRNDYLTTAQASKVLNVTRFTVLNWIKEGKLQSASTFGGHQRIPRGVVLAAQRQISTVNRVQSRPPATLAVVDCWEAKEVIECASHNCTKCLVFKKKLNRCFLAVGQYGSLKRECAHSCQECSYLAKYYPQEKRAMQRLTAPKRGVNGMIKKVFYNSGRLIGTLKKKMK